MIIDELGLPRDTGATDLQDSARLAGISTAFGHVNFDCTKYVVNGKYVRHPNEAIYDFSRDQAICLMAGLHAMGRSDLVNESYITGKDVLSPSVKGFIARCQGKKATLFQDLFLIIDIMWASYVKPRHELNQLLCMLQLAPSKYLKLLKSHHPSIEENVVNYWAGWRDEPALASSILQKVWSLL